MTSLSLLRRQLLALFKSIATPEGTLDLVAVPTLKSAAARKGEFCALLDSGGLDFTDLKARLNNDPDIDSLSRQKRVAALIDYARVAIGFIDRELSARRGHVIVSANDD
ncbi:MAG: hypothetical protein FJX66_12475 [Alphaproteobacteria bacterium]|nr:hypothetical protein [Alphaproteobacteria bacterium]